jgi:hypothetical protein
VTLRAAVNMIGQSVVRVQMEKLFNHSHTGRLTCIRMQKQPLSIGFQVEVIVNCLAGGFARPSIVRVRQFLIKWSGDRHNPDQVRLCQPFPERLPSSVRIER